jgi:hypothetical protein
MRLSTCAVLCLLAVAAPMDAAPISVLFQGTVSGVYDPYAQSWQGNLHAGDSFQFSITFDPEGVTGNPVSGGGLSYSLAADVVAEIGTFGYVGTGMTAEIFDDYLGTSDFLNLAAGVNAGVGGGILMYAQGPATLLPSLALADVDWTAFTGQSISLRIDQYGPGFQLIETEAGGLIASATLVPEPTSALLIGAGLAAVAALAPARRLR